MSSVSILLDEGVPRAVYRSLQAGGYDVSRIQDLAQRGISNGAVIELAFATSKALFTRDSDFLRLTRASQRRIKVVYLEAYPDEPDKLAKHVGAFIGRCLELLKDCQVVILSKGGAECLQI